jgi:hypothetical protein
VRRPFGVPCVARLVRRLRNSRFALRQSSPTTPDQSPLLGGRTGERKSKPKTTAWALRAHAATPTLAYLLATSRTAMPTKFCARFFYESAACCPPCGFEFSFLSPVRRLDISQASGGLGEHCPSSAVGHVLCAPLGRVAQPRLFVKYRGNPEGAAHRGRPLLVTFLGKTRKVTCCRATPDGFAFEFRRYYKPTERTPLRGDPSTGSGRTVRI